jgi:RimJ/RimL family protein N-acetyltransferase/GNAT superfamily N-acetyltransferase
MHLVSHDGDVCRIKSGDDGMHAVTLVNEPDPLSGLPVGKNVNAWPAARPGDIMLMGNFGHVERLDERHAADLWEATQGHPELWPYMGYGPFADEATFTAWIKERVPLQDPMSYAIVEGENHRAVGIATLMEIRPTMRVIEVGNILYSPALQKTPLATEAQFLLARYAFESLGYRRYEWKCNALNAPSRRAAERYGFTFEGIFRQHMIVKGRNRDTAWYSMLDSEWPARKRAFESWLAPDNFNDDGTQKRSLASFRGQGASATLAGLRRATRDDLAAVVAHMRASFGPNAEIMGAKPLPLLADYDEIFATHEIWLVESGGALEGVLILLPRADDLYVWGIATAPAVQGRGVGNRILAAAEMRARALGVPHMRLRTGEKLTKNVAWYTRHGFTIESVEELKGRRVVNMVKPLK